MSNKIFDGSTSSDFNLAENWDADTLPSAGDNLKISADALMDANDANVYGTHLIDATKTFNEATFNFSCGAVTANGTLTIGTSAGTGLTCAGLAFAIGSAANLQNVSVINNSGNYSCNNSTIFTNNYRGTYNQTESANYTNANSANIWYAFSLAASKTLTITGASSYITNSGSTTNTFGANSVIACGGNTTYIGGSGLMTIGVGFDITSTGGNLVYDFTSTTTFSDSKVNAYTHNREVKHILNSSGNVNCYIANFSNATSYIISSPGTSIARVCVFKSGTLKCINFSVENTSTGSITFNNNTNNPLFSIAGAISLNGGGGAYTTVWIKGTGSITGTGTTGTQTWDFWGLTVEDIILNCAGAIKQLTHTGTVTTDSLTITAGTLDLNGKTFVSSDGISITGTLLNGTGTASLTGTSLTTNSGAVITPTGAIGLNLSGNISLHTNTTINAGVLTWTLSGSAANIDFAGKTISTLIFNSTGTKTLTGNVTCSLLTFTAGTVDIGSNIITTAGNILFTPTCSIVRNGTLKMTGTGKTFDLGSIDTSINSVNIASGATVTFQNGAIEGKDLTCDGTATFSVADDDTIFENISGSGTILSATAATKYIYYTDTNTFAGILTNVVLAKYGEIKTRQSVNINNSLRVRI